MRTVLIGHRGVGKTSLLKRIEGYYASRGLPVLCRDLDTELARRRGQAVGEIFATEGEAAFRTEERTTFAGLDRETAVFQGDVFVALGAGFELEALPASWKALWIRRPGDARGRIFVDPIRPRLNAGLSPLAEFHERFAERENRYRARADETLILDEGLDRDDPAERAYFLNEIENLGGAITVVNEHFQGSGFAAWSAQRLAWGARWFELRDDLLSEDQLWMAMHALPAERVLVSFRSPERRARTAELLGDRAFDWPLEFGACPFAREPTFLSLHERGGALTEALARFPGGSRSILKAALPVADFQELMSAEAWRAADPERRAFLPLSDDGRWAWYRLLRAASAPLSFWRESDGSGADQPTLLQWSRRRACPGPEFAAVLGDPVAHSRTPLEHAGFFAAHGRAVYAIRVSKAEWESGALEVLRKWGLRWAAVTAPLKESAFGACSSATPLVRQLASANTLVWREGGWRGANTDQDGFRELVKGIELGETAIWGGGGTLTMMLSVLPRARAYSARTGENRSVGSESPAPRTLIWAAGTLGAEPPAAWRPERIIDLNYSEDSPARALAMSRGALYVSGLAMFRAQADGQREFWKESL